MDHRLAQRQDKTTKTNPLSTLLVFAVESLKGAVDGSNVLILKLLLLVMFTLQLWTRYFVLYAG